MRIERIFYRLSILMALIFVLGGVGMSVYSHMRASDWQEVVETTRGAMEKGYADCEESRRSLACEFIPDRREEFENSVKRRRAYEDAGKTWLKISWAASLTVIFLFYSIRWAFTGKVRPFLIETKSE